MTNAVIISEIIPKEHPKNPRFVDLTGQVFGRLTVLAYAGKSKSNISQWYCRCSCGNKIVSYTNTLRTGHTKSCGCYALEVKTKHGMARTSTYSTWLCMKSRCYCENNTKYNHYGARGIRVCDRWLDKNNGFTNFLEDMGEKPDKTYSIDRIDNDGNYKPSNCKWSSFTDQNRNQKLLQRNNKSGHKGVSWDKVRKKYIASITVNRKSINLGGFCNLQDAIYARQAGEIKYWHNL